MIGDDWPSFVYSGVPAPQTARAQKDHPKILREFTALSYTPQAPLRPDHIQERWPTPTRHPASAKRSTFGWTNRRPPTRRWPPEANAGRGPQKR
jgi:hypothetical protein